MSGIAGKHTLLLLVLIMAIFVRILPLLMYGAWGNDVGIYYYIVKEMMQNKQIYIASYPGWGSSYNLFPVLYISAIITHLIFGFDILKALLMVGPLFGGASVIIIYFISREIGLNKNISILASIILAVMPAHAYQTSHSAPLSVGHFFFLLSLLFFLKMRKNWKWITMLIPSTILLIASHHLTTYMYLISIFMIIFWNGLKGKIVWKEMIYLSTASALTFIYWGMFATPVYKNFMKGAFPLIHIHLNAVFIIFLWYSLIISSWIFLKYTKKWTFPIKLPSNMLYLFIFGFSVAILSAVVGQFFRVQWLSPYFILWSIPTAISAGFATIGWQYFRENDIHAWLFAIILSFFISLVFGFSSLIPERHIEYMCEPIAILSSYGLVKSMKKIKIHVPSARLQVAAVGVLVFSNAMSIYPVGEHAANIGEGIPETTLNAIKWMHGNISANMTIATDHRIGMLLFAEGFNTTYDHFGKEWYPVEIWRATNWQNCSRELHGLWENETCGKIWYVVIDDIMVKNGVFVSKCPTILFTNDSYRKFWKEPFILIYRNCTYADYIPPKINETIDYMDFDNETSMENVIHWTEVYKIDWNYIKEYERNTTKSN